MGSRGEFGVVYADKRAEELRAMEDWATRRWPLRWLLVGVGCGAGEFEFYVYDWFYLEEEIAGVFDAPLDVGDVKFGSTLPMIAGEFGMDGREEFVIRAVQGDDAVDFEIGGRGEGDLAIDLCWAESDISKLPGF